MRATTLTLGRPAASLCILLQGDHTDCWCTWAPLTCVEQLPLHMISGLTSTWRIPRTAAVAIGSKSTLLSLLRLRHWCDFTTPKQIVWSDASIGDARMVCSAGGVFLRFRKSVTVIRFDLQF